MDDITTIYRGGQYINSDISLISRGVRYIDSDISSILPQIFKYRPSIWSFDISATPTVLYLLERAGQGKARARQGKGKARARLLLAQDMLHLTINTITFCLNCCFKLPLTEESLCGGSCQLTYWVKRSHWTMSKSLAPHWSISLSLASHWSLTRRSDRQIVMDSESALLTHIWGL